MIYRDHSGYRLFKSFKDDIRKYRLKSDDMVWVRTGLDSIEYTVDYPDDDSYRLEKAGVLLEALKKNKRTL